MADRPIIVIGVDWYVALITYFLMFMCYFGPWKGMFISYKYYDFSLWVFEILRLLHWLILPFATLTNPGFANKISLEHFNADLQIGTKDEEDLHKYVFYLKIF